MVALSFMITALILRRADKEPEGLRVDLLALPAFRWLGHSVVHAGIETLSLFLFGLILAACFLGAQGPFDNIAPTFVWVVWWVGLAFFSALVGNLWDLVNPWGILFGWFERLRRHQALPRPYPRWLGYWPAVLLFLCFVWMELISEAVETPRNLGLAIVAYSLTTWAGMALFGRQAWLRHGEVFTVVFGLLARFAALNGEDGRFWLRCPSIGLLVRKPVPLSYVVFVLLLLTSVTFDGILETPLWQSILEWISHSQVLRPGLLSLQQAGIDLLIAIKSIALVILPAIFLSAFLITCWLIGRFGGARLKLVELSGWFVLSLVPIAIAYHLSHYLSYLLIAGQNIIPLASDPFGVGWDLFATRTYRLDIGIVNAKMVWYVAVIAIVAGHVMAVYLAHVMALRVFPSTRKALVSQLPMMALMVGYTMVSLWILSQPIVA